MMYLPLVRKVFMLGDAWGNQKLGKLHSFIIRILSYITIYYYIGTFHHFYMAFSVQNVAFVEKCNAFFIFIMHTYVIANFVVLKYRKVETKKLFKDLENFDKFGIPKNLKKVSRIVDVLCTGIVTYGGVGYVLFSLMGFIDYENCIEKDQIARNNIAQCGFTFKISYPYDVTEGALLYLHLIFEMSTSALFIFGTQSLMSGLPAVELINVRIDHLADLLNVMMVEENNDIIWRKLRFCIMYHIHIIKLTEQVNTYYRPGTTLVIISFGIIVGSTLLAVFEDCTILTVACFFGIAGPVGVLCYSGQRMYQKSLAIGDTAFGLEWYNCNKKIIKDIQFLIMRTKKPLTFQGAWGLGEFTLETFGKLMSAGYKFTSLRTSIQQ